MATVELPLVEGARQVADYDIACPAGYPIGEQLAGSGCFCRLTRTPVISGRDPSSLAAFCRDEDGYRMCPVWQAEKDELAEQRGVKMRPDAREDAPRKTVPFLG